MSYAFDVYYRRPQDNEREANIITQVTCRGGRLDYRETTGQDDGTVCLTFEFEAESSAEEAATALRECGEHVEGVYGYG